MDGVDVDTRRVEGERERRGVGNGWEDFVGRDLGQGARAIQGETERGWMVGRIHRMREGEDLPGSVLVRIQGKR